MKQLWLYITIALTMVLFSCATIETRKAEVKWYSLSEGLKIAKAEKKPCVVDFYFGKECPRCEKLDKYVYSNPDIVRRLNTEFVPIRIDLTRPLTPEEKALGEKYDYKNDCLLLFMSPDGKIVKTPAGKKLCFVDYIPPEWFMKYLDMAKSQAMSIN